MTLQLQTKRSITDGLTTVDDLVTYTVQTVVKLEEAVADAVTDQEHLVAIDVSALKAVIMNSDVVMTVETNSGSAPQETFVIPAGGSVLWREGETAVFAGDVTAIYLTNASGSAGTFRMVFGTDV